MKNKFTRLGLTFAAVLILALLLVGTAFANGLDYQNIPLNNDTAGEGTDCPTNGGPYWHFVISPNNGDSYFITFHLNLGDAATYDTSIYVPNGSQLDNVFVEVPAGKTLTSLQKLGSSADIYWNGLGVDPAKFQLSHVCSGHAQDLTLTKTAATSYTRTYDWNIDKVADPTLVYTAGGAESEPVDFTVSVEKTGYTDSDWAVTGQITVHNPNKFDVTGVNITDGACTVTDGADLTVPAGGDAVASYVCELDGAIDGTNVATATWTDFGSPNTSASASADYVFGEPSIVANTEINVTDTNGGTWLFSDTGSVSYQMTYDGPAGTCTDYKNIASIDETGQSASATVTDCQGADLIVTKTAVPTFTRTFHWDIAKSVEPPLVYTAGGAKSDPVDFTVNVTKTGYTDSDWAVTGVIHIVNPNDWEDITLSSLVDVVNNGGICTVNPGPYVVPMGGSLDVAYSCSFASGEAGKNMAKAYWDSAAYHTPNGAAYGTADFAFTTPTTLVNDEIDVVDTNGMEWHFADSGTETYQMTYADPAGTCTSHENTVTIKQTDQSASATVTDCQGADLTIEKTALPSYDLTYTWDPQKNVIGETSKTVDAGYPASFDYEVIVTHDNGTESNWQVNGAIVVTNPNDWQAVYVDVIDSLPGASCTVDGGSNVLVPASGSVKLTYQCVFDANPGSGTNSALVTWDSAAYHTPSGSALATADFTFGAPTNVIDECVDVDDTVAGFLGTVCVGDANPKVFTYTASYNGPAAGTCKEYDNVATTTTNDTGAKDSDKATVKVCSYIGRLTPGYWKNHLALNGTTGCRTLPGGTGCASNGPFAMTYLPQLLGNFSVNNIATAAKIFVGMNCSSTKDQDSVGCLAGHLLAAKLNVANGANVCINTTIVNADTFLKSVNYVGPTGRYVMTASQRALAINLKSALDVYNNGNGCH
jgi:hypothetical protein